MVVLSLLQKILKGEQYGDTRSNECFFMDGIVCFYIRSIDFLPYSKSKNGRHAGCGFGIGIFRSILLLSKQSPARKSRTDGIRTSNKVIIIYTLSSESVFFRSSGKSASRRSLPPPGRENSIAEACKNWRCKPCGQTNLLPA